MSAIILNGKSLASDFESEIKKETEQLISKGITPTLATILVGLDPASATYVKMKQSTCQRLGMKSIAVELDEKTTTNELLNKIDELNKDDSVHGILLQHPVPSHINERKCFDAYRIRQRCRWRYLLRIWFNDDARTSLWIVHSSWHYANA